MLKIVQGKFGWQSPAVTFACVALALAGFDAILMASGHSAVTTDQEFFRGAFGSQSAWTSTLQFATPLMFTGLAAAAAFRMNLFNIGGEGQLYVGAVGASGVGLALAGRPALLVITAMCVAGAISGTIWAAIPGSLKVWKGVNGIEVIVSLMLNYVAGLVLNYLIIDSHSYWRDPTQPAFPTAKTLGSTAVWPSWGSSLVIPLGSLIALAAAFGLWLAYRHTRFGAAVQIMADSPRAARYAGIRTRRLTFTVMCLSGALAGLAGASLVGDFSHNLDVSGFQQSYFGYNGIVVAALARYRPWATCMWAVLLGGAQNAGFSLQGANLPSGLSGILNGLILLTIVGGEEWSARHRSQKSPIEEVAQ